MDEFCEFSVTDYGNVKIRRFENNKGQLVAVHYVMPDGNLHEDSWHRDRNAIKLWERFDSGIPSKESDSSIESHQLAPAS